MTQDQALEILKTGASVFLTGEPGSGKTYVVNSYVRWLKKHKIDPGVTASTGIAATHIGGMTIHSFSGIGVAEFLSKYDVDRIASIERIARRVLDTSVLIIDEVSMLAGNTLELVDMVFREVRKSELPFGGMQVVLVGDFFQLPPVAREGRNAVFAFESKSWEFLNPVVCYLTDQYRQEDKIFLDILSAIRGNCVEDSHFELISGRMADTAKSFDSIPKLFSHNTDVDAINSRELLKLPNDPKVFSMISKGAKVLVEQLKRGCLSPEKLELKKDAVVMFTKNSPLGKFVNGTLGAISGFDQETGLPIVKCKDGSEVIATPMKWTIEEHGSVKAMIEQIPLRLAWAITVHKSQGMTLDEAVVDLSKAFEYGQGYVALSRVRALAGLHLLGINSKALLVHPKILAKDNEFRNASVSAEEKLRLLAQELRELQVKFIQACGGRALEKSAPASFEKIREAHPNAYRPWDKGQELELRKLFLDGMSVGLLAKTLGRKPGGIKSRLLKLGLAKK